MNKWLMPLGKLFPMRLERLFKEVTYVNKTIANERFSSIQRKY